MFICIYENIIMHDREQNECNAGPPSGERGTGRGDTTQHAPVIPRTP